MSNRGDRRKIFFPHEGYLLLCDEGGVDIFLGNGDGTFQRR